MLKLTLYAVLAGAAGMIVCLGVGFLVVSLHGVPDGASFGVGLEPWNLPGTILGAGTWLGITYLSFRKRIIQKPPV
jgi:hypothetical protein